VERVSKPERPCYRLAQSDVEHCTFTRRADRLLRWSGRAVLQQDQPPAAE
jgi:hypothetical protein